MLHPVGHLPAAVYWRRRVLVLGLLVAVVGGGGWFAVAALTARHGLATAAATGPATPSVAEAAATAAAAPSGAPPAAAAVAPACADEALSVEVQAPPAATPGGRVPFELRITNSAPLACVRALDATRQEIVLLDLAGRRLWSSDDCVVRIPGIARTLAPGEAVSFPVTWNGLTSEPTCAVPGVALAPGPYVLRGRLDTKTTRDRALVLG